MAFAQEKSCAIDDIYALSDGQRAEPIDGQRYMMALFSENLKNGGI